MKNTVCPDLWRSVAITHRGNVSACCLNKPEKIGNIYETPLSQLINCDTIVKHRCDSLDGKLCCYDGCTWVRKTAEPFPGPVIRYSDLRNLTIGFGERCNIRCIMCRQRNGRLPSAETLDVSILEQNVDLMPFQHIFLTGGEPLAIPGCREYMEYLNRKDKKYSFSTNGMLLDPKTCRTLAPHLDFLTVSLNAATRETHERVNIGSSFDTVIGNIRALAGARKASGNAFDIVGRMTITVPALNEIPAFIERYQELGFDRINFGFDRATVVPFLDADPAFRSSLKKKVTEALASTNDLSRIDRHRLCILGLASDDSEVI